MNIPHLEHRGDKTVLIVHDLPLILLAGEVHNSSSSSLSYMEGVWDKAEELGMNALLLPVAWETVEPLEGTFDFALVDGLIGQTRDADARAFAALMAHLREFDGTENTVVAVQVENETGLLGAAREVSDEADALFETPVPADLAGWLRTHMDTMVPDVREAVEGGASAGSWAEVFGPAADELFSAYHTARYVESVAAAGKAEYPLPMAVNCWLDKGGAPGTYPSGGPVSRTREVWRFAAPSIDLYGPDIYVPDFCGVCLGIKTGPDECILLVCRCGLAFVSSDPERPNLDILSLEEGRMENGGWRTLRRLNGDEAAFMMYDTPALLRVKVFIYD